MLYNFTSDPEAGVIVRDSVGKFVKLSVACQTSHPRLPQGFDTCVSMGSPSCVSPDLLHNDSDHIDAYVHKKKEGNLEF